MYFTHIRFHTVVRLVTKSPLDTNRIWIYDTLGWMTVSQLIKYHSILSVYRIRKSNEPEYLANLLNRDNRNNNIIVPQSNMELYRRSFVYRSICDWNNLPKEIRNIQKIMPFKKTLKSWIKINITKF